MKHITKDYVTKTLKDNWWVSLVVANIILTIVSVFVIALSIQPKGAKVFTHYSAFSVTQLYSGYWYFLWNYAILAIIVLVSHCLLALKLRHIDRRDLALALLWGTLGMTLLILIFARLIINIAALG